MDVGTGLSQFKRIYPNRFFDVGIAEEHAVAMAAAMSAKGMLPVCAIYSTFLQRGYDQILHDAALNKNHLILAIDRSGPVGADGPTHHGLFDTSYLRSVPGMTVYAPSSHAELSSAIRKAIYEVKGPVAVKYPRGAEKTFKDDTFDYDVVRLREGTDVTLIGYGIMINNVSDAADALLGSGISAEVIKLNRIDKTNDELIEESVRKTGLAVICEDCVQSGSVGEAVAAFLAGKKIICKVRLINFKSSFAEIGSIDEIYEEHGLSVSKIVKEIKGELSK